MRIETKKIQRQPLFNNNHLILVVKYRRDVFDDIVSDRILLYRPRVWH